MSFACFEWRFFFCSFDELMSWNIFKKSCHSSWTRIDSIGIRSFEPLSTLFQPVQRQELRSYCLESSQMKVLNVAEKNDAAKNIANILSRGTSRRREGLSTYNKVYEFDYDVPSLGKCSMQMTSVAGHLTNLDFSSTHRSWHSCRPAELFDAQIITKTQPNLEPVRNNILNLVKYSSVLIIWTDCDREGENIGFEIINVCREVKPNIRVFRARFSEITSRSIIHAIHHLVQPDKAASDAVEIRKELDLRIGAAFTRLQTIFLQKRITLDGLASYGSCQFPTLGFVVERFKEREDFVVQPFWFLEVKHKKNDILVNFNWQRNRLFDMIQVLELYRKVLSPPVVAKVVSVDAKPKSKWRPTPMDTVTLEKLSSSKLKINAKTTMKIAEKLYTGGLISYPRTETNIFPPDLNIKSYVEHQIQSSEWGSFAQHLLASGITPRNGKNSDKAHPPIYPTKFTSNLSGDESRVYELICRHFLATCSLDATGSETTVNLSINGESFHISGLVIYHLNYLHVYKYEKWTEKPLPEFKVGESFVPDQILMMEGKTTPPLLLSESDLIALMEKHGIGTDATHADHIETIKERKYVNLTNDRRFYPAALGLGLIEGYNKIKDQMSKPHLRAALEKDLQAVCEGRKNPNLVLSEQILLYRNIFADVSAKLDILGTEVKNRFDNDPGDGGAGDGDGGGDDDEDGFGGGGGGKGSNRPGHRGFEGPSSDQPGRRGSGGAGSSSNQPRRHASGGDELNGTFHKCNCGEEAVM